MESINLTKYRELLRILQVDLLRCDLQLRQNVVTIIRCILNSPSDGVSFIQIRDSTALSESVLDKALKTILIKESPFYLYREHVYVADKDYWLHKGEGEGKGEGVLISEELPGLDQEGEEREGKGKGKRVLISEELPGLDVREREEEETLVLTEQLSEEGEEEEDEEVLEAAPKKKCKGFYYNNKHACSKPTLNVWRKDLQGNKTLCNSCGVRLKTLLRKIKGYEPGTHQHTSALNNLKASSHEI